MLNLNASSNIQRVLQVFPRIAHKAKETICKVSQKAFATLKGILGTAAGMVGLGSRSLVPAGIALGIAGAILTALVGKRFFGRNNNQTEETQKSTGGSQAGSPSGSQAESPSVKKKPVTVPPVPTAPVVTTPELKEKKSFQEKKEAIKPEVKKPVIQTTISPAKPEVKKPVVETTISAAPVVVVVIAPKVEEPKASKVKPAAVKSKPVRGKVKLQGRGTARTPHVPGVLIPSRVQKQRRRCR